MKKVDNLELLDNLIVGRVTPHIYAFQTGTIPNYLKVGDTYRPVSIRLKEWERKFPDLIKKYEHKATVSDNVYFRDYAVHDYLENSLGKKRLEPEDLSTNNVYYSREFFKDVNTSELDEAINDICEQYKLKNSTYAYYDSNKRLAVTVHYERGAKWTLRPNQQEAVDNFIKAVNLGRTNLLMYAVMRFGKSFTSLACAKAINAKTVLIVSAKADVREEWKKNVEQPGNFEDYNFLTSKELLENDNAISDIHAKDETAVIFLTLQDLQGTEIKAKHAQVFENKIDLLIVDETHFGARAQSYGEILRNVQTDEKKEIKDNIKFLDKQEDDQIDLEDADKQIKELKAKVRLHLSGTPYRILMGSEFEPEDIISFVQFTDIAREQAAWDAENLNKDDVEEWDNPYFGFPQMIRFAFHPSRRAIEKINELKKHGVSLALSALFKPQSIKKDTKTNAHQKFVHEDEVFDLLKIIDGTSSDSKLLGFLDYDKIKQGQMCRHIVMVLPYCASCDAMEKLINDHALEFKNLGEYEILNISGVDAQHHFHMPTDIKNRIAKLELEGKKTLTLTVNRMLTGSTVEQWDTMIYLKDTSSPQEYDQAIFRLQNQYVRELSDGTKVIKECLKPQTLLVDFDPHRLFTMQEQKSLIYNANTEKNGNSLLDKRIADELRISPVITMNHNRLEQVQATDILKEVSHYNNSRSISDEVMDLPIDLSILNNEHMRDVIEAQNPFGSKAGLTLEANESETDGQDFDVEYEDLDDEQQSKQDNKSKQSEFDQYTLNVNNERIKDLENKIRTYYQRILFFSFLCYEPVKSLDDILENLRQGKNHRLAHNLGINTDDIEVLRNSLNAFKLSALDYKIQNISTLATDENLQPLDRAVTSLAKFSRMSASEIITPIKVADEMVAMLSEDQLRNIIKSGEKLLDIASKAGEYTVALVKRLQALGFTLDEIRNSIYAIPTSSVAYEFTRRFYEILGLNIACIAKNFTSYNLLDIKKDNEEVDYNRITELLSQKKDFEKITLQDNIQGGEKVEFGAVVGNPPYQESDGGAQASARPIYHKFVEITNQLSTNLVTLIIPTRWYAGGKGLDQFREHMLANTYISQLHDFINPEIVFPGTNNRGGVCYFLIDKSMCNQTERQTRIITHTKGKNDIISIRPLNSISLGIFIRDSIGVEIAEKLIGNKAFSPLSNEISSRKPFGYDGKIIKSNQFHKEPSKMQEPILCYGKAQLKGYVERSSIQNHPEWIDCYKVFIPRANNIGTELNDDNQNVFVGLPKEVCSETYILAGTQMSLTKETATFLAKYMKTKFARFLHRLIKVSQDASKQTYRFVPVPDLSKDSPINWNLSLNDIDEQLFNFYGLNEEEKQHIRNSIKDMN
ncbi:Eco57I restriction-modification methylase domain-containing protein [Gardnerella vaginalis]|uniref:Eco57I restriction-modification methylase domain-containing protein n=1 Tax=Gardnerella vaginalis TaxID=2702 RepID=UPI000311EE19|nr:Eco57I restriction-modification methylase domain-containing protein [Gardnerella vaginalis]